MLSLSELETYVVAAGTPINTYLRLVDGPSAGQGRVAVLRGGLWGGLCISTPNGGAATTICRALGYRQGESLAEGTYGHDYVNMGVLRMARCTGEEDTLFQCSSVTTPAPGQLCPSTGYYPGWAVSCSSPASEAGVQLHDRTQHQGQWQLHAPCLAPSPTCSSQHAGCACGYSKL